MPGCSPAAGSFDFSAARHCTAKAVAQSNVELVSAEPLLNLGIFRTTVGDFGPACQPSLQNGSVGTKPDGQIGPEWRVFLDSVERAFGRRYWLAGAPGFEPGNGGIKICPTSLIEHACDVAHGCCLMSDVAVIEEPKEKKRLFAH